MTAAESSQPRPVPGSTLLRLLAAECVLAACFLGPLVSLARFAYASDLYSHILLIPFICIYLVRASGGRVLFAEGASAKPGAALMAAGAALIASRAWALKTGVTMDTEVSLGISTLSFLLLAVGLAAAMLGVRILRTFAFPAALLLLMVPFPAPVTNWIEGVLQHGSAAAAVGLLRLCGTPVFFSDLSLQLQTITLEVAPECSGLRSTLALFITSLIAGHLLLRSPWRRSVLVLVVFPLAILRNGFRVFVIGELCVHIGPQMIDSYIHRHGGPIFFALSLVPFFSVLYVLMRMEKAPESRR